MTRRLFLSLASTLGVLATVPMSLLAKRNDDAFKTKDLNSALKSLYGTSETMDGKIKIKAPEIAENGAAVPITISASGDVKSISFFVEGDITVLSGHLDIPKMGVAKISTRIKLAKTSNLIAIANIDGKLYKSTRKITVTIGGCGG